MTMFSGAPYNKRTCVVYVFTGTIILKLRYFMINNVLFYNTKVCDIGMPHGMVNIGEEQKTIDRKCMFLYSIEVFYFKLNRCILCSCTRL